MRLRLTRFHLSRTRTHAYTRTYTHLLDDIQLYKFALLVAQLAAHRQLPAVNSVHVANVTQPVLQRSAGVDRLQTRLHATTVIVTTYDDVLHFKDIDCLEVIVRRNVSMFKWKEVKVLGTHQHIGSPTCS